MSLVAAACITPPEGPANIAPVAVATATPDNGQAPLEVAFSSTGSADADGTIASYAWDFGDSSSSTDADPIHIYSVAGTYSVSLTVTDNDGATGTARPRA